MVTHLLPYILTIPSCGHCVRNRGVGCALAWVNIARDSESDHPFYPVVQFRTILAGHLWCQISSGSIKSSLIASSGSYCTRIIVGSRVMITHFLPYILTIPLCGHCVRNRGVGCALAWVTIARDSESDYPIYPVVQFRRIRAGH